MDKRRNSGGEEITQTSFENEDEVSLDTLRIDHSGGGLLIGRVAMRYALDQNNDIMRIRLSSMVNQRELHVNIQFHNRNPELVAALQTGTMICIPLSHAKFKGQTPSSTLVPFKLVFEDYWAVKVVSGNGSVEQGRIVYADSGWSFPCIEELGS